MRFRLRTLLLVTAITPLLVGGGIRAYWAYEKYLKHREQERVLKLLEELTRELATQITVDSMGAEGTHRAVLHQLENSESFFDEQEGARQFDMLCAAIRGIRKRREVVEYPQPVRRV